MSEKLLTIREIIEIEIDYRLHELKMPKRRVAQSLGYSEKGFRLMCDRLKKDPEYKPRVNNESTVPLKSRPYKPRGIYKKLEVNVSKNQKLMQIMEG